MVPIDTMPSCNGLRPISIGPSQNLQTNRVVDGSCAAYNITADRVQFVPKSVNLYEIPAAVHVLR